MCWPGTGLDLVVVEIWFNYESDREYPSGELLLSSLLTLATIRSIKY